VTVKVQFIPQFQRRAVSRGVMMSDPAAC